MRILAFDSSGRIGSAALLSERGLEAELTLQVKRTHSEHLVPAVVQVLQTAGWRAADLDALAVTTGPGSFTGLRIGLGTAKAMAWALQKPLAAVGTLEAWAFGFLPVDGVVCPLLAARRGEVYAGVFCPRRDPEPGPAGPWAWPEQVGPLFSGPVDQFLHVLSQQRQSVLFCGDGLDYYRPALLQWAERFPQPVWLAPAAQNCLRAAWVGALGLKRLQTGEASDPRTLTAVYLRPSEAEVKAGLGAQTEGGEAGPLRCGP
ncbi:MAG: tRNA (adenosine(37)-N6)-threonylcarbamoyltransferase complex dimerization subunit type 1 TsaB [Firmicutes bacterium]|nr:tRNA (adenosine(37)-N6)-threonylcarbamoyltransferase complex dimerization subunit type 1 TsaB [Bacillota bacterium]